MKTTKKDKNINALMEGITLINVQETEMRMEIAACLYDAIIKCGMTPHSFASRLGISNEIIDLWLSGTIDIPTESLYEAESALNTDIKFPSSIYV